MRLPRFAALVLLASASAPLAAAASAGAAAAPRPNILLILLDQWRHDWLPSPLSSAFPALAMPTVLQLARAGTRFAHATVPSPLCAPSRACLASGREYDEAGVPDNFSNDYPLNETTIYTLLRDVAGYTTLASGKDDLCKSTGPGADGSYHAAALGFSDYARVAGKQDVVNRGVPFEPYGLWCAARSIVTNGTNRSLWSLLESAVRDACATAPATPSGYDCAGYTPLPQAAYEDDWVAASTLALLARAPAGVPWFAQVSFPGPHPPFVVTAAMLNTTSHDPAAPLAANNSATPAAAQQHVRRAYAAELEHLDGLIASLLAAVDAAGARDDTLVILASDHGEMLGDLDDWGKTMPWQGSASVPLIVVGPGVGAGVVVDAPVATLDIAGTILDYAGVAPAPNMTTRSLRAYLEAAAPPAGAPPPPPPRAFVSSGLAQWRSVLQVPPANASAIFKLVCCRGACPGGMGGAPYLGGDAADYRGVLAPAAGVRTYEADRQRPQPRRQQEKGEAEKEAAANVVKLFDIVDDPFDLYDISGAHPEAVTRMAALLPPGWCSKA